MSLNKGFSFILNLLAMFVNLVFFISASCLYITGVRVGFIHVIAICLNSLGFTATLGMVVKIIKDTSENELQDYLRETKPIYLPTQNVKQT